MPGDAPEFRAAIWLRDAESDLALASVKKTPKIRYAHLCFHAQQTTEKALKAILLAHGVTPPRTHDLAFIVDSLPKDVTLPPSLLMLPVLTKYAVQHRYPGQDMPVDRRDYKKALALAGDTLAWAREHVSDTHER